MQQRRRSMPPPPRRHYLHNFQKTQLSVPKLNDKDTFFSLFQAKAECEIDAIKIRITKKPTRYLCFALQREISKSPVLKYSA